MKKIEVKLTFTEELLGTASGNQELHADFIRISAHTRDFSRELAETIYS